MIVGTAVIAEARRQNYEVLAVSRRGKRDVFLEDRFVEYVSADATDATGKFGFFTRQNPNTIHLQLQLQL